MEIEIPNLLAPSTKIEHVVAALVSRKWAGDPEARLNGWPTIESPAKLKPSLGPKTRPWLPTPETCQDESDQAAQIVGSFDG